MSSLGLVGDHSADGLPQHTAGGTEVERTTGRVDIAPFAQVGQELDLVPEEVSRQLQILAAHNHYLTSIQDLLGNDGGQTAQQMAATVDKDWLKKTNKTKTHNLSTSVRFHMCKYSGEPLVLPTLFSTTQFTHQFNSSTKPISPHKTTGSRAINRENESISQRKTE